MVTPGEGNKPPAALPNRTEACWNSSVGYLPIPQPAAKSFLSYVECTSRRRATRTTTTSRGIIDAVLDQAGSSPCTSTTLEFAVKQRRSAMGSETGSRRSALPLRST